MNETLERILAEDYVGDLTTLSIDDVRDRRAECKRVETGLSYVRRLVQGRLDVAAAEQARRADGGDGDDLEDLIARLPALLAGRTRGEGFGRLPETIDPGEVDEELQSELDDIITSSRLAAPGQLSDDELATAVRQLTDFERRVSRLRRQLFDRIDAFEAELTRRYRTGEATVDGLLR